MMADKRFSPGRYFFTGKTGKTGKAPTIAGFRLPGLKISQFQKPGNREIVAIFRAMDFLTLPPVPAPNNK